MNKNPAESDQSTTGPMSMAELKARTSIITATVLSVFGSIYDFGAALSAKINSETEGRMATGDLHQHFHSMIIDIQIAADKATNLRREVIERGVKGGRLLGFVNYLSEVEGGMMNNILKEKFRWVSQFLAQSEDFFDVFLIGMIQKLNNLEEGVVALEAAVVKLERQGKGAFSAAETYYGPMSPSFMLGQILANHADAVPLFSALEMSVAAIDAAESGRPFMGVTYATDNAPTADQAEDTVPAA